MGTARALEPEAAEAATDPMVAVMLETPLGTMIAAGTSSGLCLLEFHDRRAMATEFVELRRLLGAAVVSGALPDSPGPVRQAARELNEYFEGRRTVFEVPLLRPGTPFEGRVWDALLQIPCGQTRSYGQVAMQVGSPGGSRAVGRANGRNRIAIMIPCHRVIDASGNLHGYGGGLERKKWLLEHEAGMMGTRLWDASPERLAGAEGRGMA